MLLFADIIQNKLERRKVEFYLEISSQKITKPSLSGCQDKGNNDRNVPEELVKKPTTTLALKIKQTVICRDWKDSRFLLDKSFCGLA